jgi:Co/Zn/Cd efflux system component
VGVLTIAIVLDGVSRTIAVRELRGRAQRNGVGLRQLLAESADPTITTVYLEDTVDVLGATLALAALILHRVTGSGIPDAIATLVIGALLTFVAARLTRRNRLLLTNQAVPERHVDHLRERLLGQPGIVQVQRIEAVHLGPQSVLAAAEVVVTGCMTAGDVAATLHAARLAIRTEVPDITRLYLTPVAAL